MAKTSLKILLITGIVLGLSSCGPEMLKSGNTWRLTSIKENSTLSAVPTGIMITLSVDGTSLSGYSGCNVYNGPMAIESGKLKLGPFASTMRMCGDGEIARLEPLYMSLLDKTVDSKEENGRLIFYDGSKNPILVFDMFTLTGTSWQLTGYNMGTAIVNTDAEHGQNAEVAFNASGKLSGSTGFNNFMGTYELQKDSSRIKIKPSGMTRMAAPSQEASKFEQLYIKMLSDTSKYAVSGNTLTLLDSKGITLLQFTLKAN